MSGIQCREIFNAVYTYVRGSYISNLFTTKTKCKTVNENINEDENSNKTQSDVAPSETVVNSTKTMATNSETICESVDRMAEEEVADKIRMDIDEKFPFALASVCSNLATIDSEYRKMKGYDPTPDFSEYYIEISEEFPLCDRFVFSAIMFVCSMILIDVDEKRSDDFYHKYASSVSQIISELPCEMLKTVEKYPY